ncbi:MAG: FAD-dependent oxidoreductase [Gammaproteobacteria bacterium]
MALTRKRNLRTGTPVWSAYRHSTPPSSPLKRSVRADVVVVGAGITGALVAQRMCELGLRPLILERRRGALLGSTAASTALLQFELDTPLVHLARKIGKRAAGRVWQCSHWAVNELRTQVRRLDVQARLETRPSLYLAGDLLNAAGLRREVLARQRFGLPSEFLDRSALRHHFSVHRAAAILSHGNAEADPVALSAGFLWQALGAGARLHAPHEVTDLHAHGRYVTIATAEGIEIRARHVVLCTGYELPKIVPAAKHEIFSTWAIATAAQPAKVWPQRALVWEASEPYLYMRATADGRVICGGEDEEFADDERRDALIPRKTARLQTKLGRLFPQLDARAAFAWAGSFGSSTSGTPSFGPIPGYPRCFAVLGYGGNGITFSMLAASMIARAVRGRPHADSKLFAFE